MAGDTTSRVRRAARLPVAWRPPHNPASFHPWIAMAISPPAGPRLLFVIDNDYGGLGLVMYFLHGQPFASRATLLLPARAQELHKGRLPVAWRAYRSLRDILDAVEAESPDVVILVSGYLFHSQGVLKLAQTRELVRVLRQRGCVVATTDPYLGTFR